MEALTVPSEVTPAWCQAAAAALDAAGRSGETALADVLPAAEACHLINRCRQLLQPEPTLLEVSCSEGW